MFGFIIGALSLAGLIGAVRHRRHWGYSRFGRRGGHHGGAQRWVLWRLFERLEATPGQEKVISSAVEDVLKSARGLREGLFSARSEVAKAFRGATLDQEALKQLFLKHDRAAEGAPTNDPGFAEQSARGARAGSARRAG